MSAPTPARSARRRGRKAKRRSPPRSTSSASSDFRRPPRKGGCGEARGAPLPPNPRPGPPPPLPACGEVAAAQRLTEGAIRPRGACSAPLHHSSDGPRPACGEELKGHAMLDANMTGQLKQYFAMLREPIELVASLGDDAKSEQTRELLSEIAALSDKVSAR